MARVCGGASWGPSGLLLSCFAEEQLRQFGAMDPSAMRLQDWAYLHVSVALEQWGRNGEESRRILPFPCRKSHLKKHLYLALEILTSKSNKT